jgi:plastocyanin
MKNKILIFSLVFFLVLIVSACGSKNKQTEPIVTPSSSESLSAETSTISKVTISNFAFDPAVLKIKQGTTVTWVNNDSVPHPIKSDFFSSDSLNKGQSFSFTFNNIGNFDYLCSIHPTMKGLIIVE